MQLVFPLVSASSAVAFPSQDTTQEKVRALLQLLSDRARAPKSYYDELRVTWIALCEDAGVDDRAAEVIISPLSTAHRWYELCDELRRWLEHFLRCEGEWSVHYLSQWHHVPTRSPHDHQRLRALIDQRYLAPPSRSG